jgi:CheY-like chemotaxis protein
LDRYHAEKYDVVLTDNRMPGMTGLELAAQIKARNPSQLVILFSGSPPVQQSAVCDLILLKPFSASELRKAVARLAAATGPTPLPTELVQPARLKIE